MILSTTSIIFKQLMSLETDSLWQYTLTRTRANVGALDRTLWMSLIFSTIAPVEVAVQLFPPTIKSRITVTILLWSLGVTT